MNNNTRAAQLSLGLRLEYFTIGWNSVEAGVAIGAGILASSIALIGFGLDSLVEVCRQSSSCGDCGLRSAAPVPRGPNTPNDGPYSPWA
jgi:hypothetical protein